MSWAVTYVVGLYALGLQVRPDLTPDQFYKAAVETGWYTEDGQDGKTYRIGPIMNPAALVNSLRK